MLPQVTRILRPHRVRGIEGLTESHSQCLTCSLLLQAMAVLAQHKLALHLHPAGTDPL